MQTTRRHAVSVNAESKKSYFRIDSGGLLEKLGETLGGDVVDPVARYDLVF